jgi:hypothetical protein
MNVKNAVKIVLIVLVAFVFATVGNALAAANTVPASSAGDGTGAISGYIVNSIHYNLNAIPLTIDTVTFSTTTTVSVGSTIKIELVTAGSWYDCTFAAKVPGPGSNVTCTTTGVSVQSVNNLRIVISD